MLSQNSRSVAAGGQSSFLFFLVVEFFVSKTKNEREREGDKVNELETKIDKKAKNEIKKKEAEEKIEH